ncbi:MAG: protein translocase subunit SecF [Chloroflexi bacterium]|nr:protein translocase subunit SecF [Chloroflexota bacterium]
MFDFVARRRWFYWLSILIVVPGVVSMLLPGGFRPGIDFTSGTLLQLRFAQEVEQEAVRRAFGEAGHPDAVVQRANDGTFLIRTRPLGQVTDEAEGAGQSERTQLLETLRGSLGEVEILALDQVSPVIAEEIVRYSGVAVAAACLGILVYLWWAFRKVPRSIRYGSCAVIALVHDAVALLGIFSLLGRFTTIELDAMFITAVLTTIGFSVHDTIVVFDRVRENIVRHAGESFADIVNHSLIQTLGRSINTSITSFLTLLALYIFGGSTIQSFVLAILIGVALGTYSSIFNASLLLYSWETGELRRLPAVLFGGQGASPDLVLATTAPAGGSDPAEARRRYEPDERGTVSATVRGARGARS